MHDALKIFFFVLLIFPSSAWSAPALKLSDYLEQVKQGNGAYRASQMISQGAEATSKEGKLLTRPEAYGVYTYTNDRTPQIFSSAFGNQTVTQAAEAGVRQATDLGLEVKAGYRYNDVHLNGVNPLFIPNNHYRTASPVIELNQPLLRNGFGREIRARKDALKSQALATAHNEAFKMDQVLAEAKRIYWDLILARQTIVARSELVHGGQALLDWARTRMDRQLGDRSDFLQAQALVRLQALELRNAQDWEKNLSRQFNTLRGRDSNVVAEKLVTPTPFGRKADDLPVQPPLRRDVKALQEASKAARAEARLGRERNMPSFNLIAGASLNSLNPDAGAVLEESLSENPTVTAGFNFTVPLSFGLSHEVRRGYVLQAKGYEEAIRHQSFENDRNYLDLRSRVMDAHERLGLARSIEEAQKEKYTFEREKLVQGRSTTFQVLNFQEAWVKSQLDRLAIEAQTIALETDLELYVTRFD